MAGRHARRRRGRPGAVHAGQYWRFASRPGVTADGKPYWVGGITNTPGGTTQNRGLFYSTGATVVLLGGTAVPGLPFPPNTGTAVDFDYRYSAYHERERRHRLRMGHPEQGEVDHAGFHVYRATDAAGPYARLTRKLVRGTSPYAYVDAAVEPGATYHYRLGAVERFGVEEMLGRTTTVPAGSWRGRDA